MKLELELDLAKRFPAIYGHYQNDQAIHPISFGFRCGDGWQLIIERMSERLAYLSDLENKPVSVLSVTRLRGSLNVKLSVATDLMLLVVSRAELESEWTCEVCGARGQVTRLGEEPKARCPLHGGHEV